MYKCREELQAEWRAELKVNDTVNGWQLYHFINDLKGRALYSLCKVYAKSELDAWCRFESALLKGCTPSFNLGLSYIPMDWSVIEAQRAAQIERRIELEARALEIKAKSGPFFEALGKLCTEHGVDLESDDGGYLSISLAPNHIITYTEVNEGEFISEVIEHVRLSTGPS